MMTELIGHRREFLSGLGAGSGSLALAATSAISDDGILDPRDTRTVLGLCLSVVRNTPIEGAPNYGVFRL